MQTFVSAWVTELHAHGYVAGVYGSAASTIRDLQALATPAPARRRLDRRLERRESVFGNPYVTDSLWTNHQRIHQYRGGHNETYGGVTIDIDSSYVDGAVVGSAGSAADPGAARHDAAPPASPPPAR